MPRNVNETQQSDWIMPPMATAIVALAAGVVEVDVDLTTMKGSPAKANVTVGSDDYNPNPIGHYLNLQADGADIYVAFAASLGALGALSTSAVNTVTANAIGAQANATVKIPNGSTLPVKLPIGTPSPTDNADVGKASPSRYLGFLTAAGTGTLRMWQSSP